jgi:NADH-quinone oxidoreductase subunit N
MSWSDLGTISPVVAAVLVAAAILLVDMAVPNRREAIVAVALGGLGVVAAIILIQAGHTGSAFGGSYSLDNLTVFLDMLFVVIGALTILFAGDYLEPRGLPIAEFAAVLVFAVTGAMLVAGSTDLLLLFVALELMVMPGYMLAGFARHDPYSTEGAIKYFLLGSFSSAILLFGLAYVWGMTGTTRVDGVAAALAAAAAKGSIQPGLAMGLAFMTAGVAFKMAAVPFHYWTPDAYQGSPTPVTAYLSVGPKIGVSSSARWARSRPTGCRSSSCWRRSR